MKKPTVKIDWTLAENDEAWQATQNATPTEPAPTPRHRQAQALATLVAALLLLLTGGWLWQQPAPTKRPPTNLSSTLLLAEQPITPTISVQDKPAPDGVVQRLGDHVMTQVTATYPEDGKLRSFRQTRFYEKSASEWQRIAPDPKLLGPQRTLTIANFTILYYAVDADAVYEMAPKLAQLYATLRQDFDLPVAVATSSYTIEVATERLSNAPNFNFLLHTVTVSSPSLLSIPVEMPAATALYQELIYPLARLLIFETIDPHDQAWKAAFLHWQPIELALPLWELWQEGGPLGSGRDQLISWLYKNGKNATIRQPLPDGYETICRIYHIWKIAPSELSIPLTCSDADKKRLPNQQLPALASTWPQPIDHSGKSDTQPENSISDVLTTETIIEYIVATYGRDKLPHLVDALGQHTTTETLIPTLFGISTNDFEAHWQAYLAQHY